jgi:thiol:disulfide interchange protein DsbD
VLRKYFNKRTFWLVALFSSALVLTASAQENAATVKVETVKPAHVMTAGTARALLEVNVANGFHINSDKPKAQYLIPTSLSIAPSSGIEVARVQWPAPHDRKFSFSDEPLSVFEGTFPVTVSLKAAGATPGEHTLKGKLRYQACNDQICKPPATAEVSIPVRVSR